MMIIRKYDDKDIEQMISIWNEIVEEGVAFPQEDNIVIVAILMEG